MRIAVVVLVVVVVVDDACGECNPRPEALGRHGGEVSRHRAVRWNETGRKESGAWGGLLTRRLNGVRVG